MAERNDTEISTASRDCKRKFCPFVGQPFADCFCVDTGSESAEAAIRLCGGDFEQCEIYRSRKTDVIAAFGQG